MLRRCSKRTVRGFTLIECMLVIALSLLLIMLTTASFSFMRTWLVRVELDLLATVCNYAQHCALITGKQQTIQFNEMGRCYTFNDRIYYLSPGVHFGCIPGVQGPPKNPRAALSKPITFIGNQILFSEHGIMSSGTVYLTDTNTSVLYALSNPVSHTSFLRRYVYQNKWVVLN